MVRLLSAGYGNLGFDGFISRLRSFDVTHLVDVRAVPWSSYHVDFRRENLPDLVRRAGLRYVYMGDTLGGIKGSSALCKDPESVPVTPEQLLERPELGLGMSRLLGALGEDRVICLMCGCLRAEVCHRSWLLGEALALRGVALAHLDEFGNLRDQAEIMSRRQPAQSSLF